MRSPCFWLEDAHSIGGLSQDLWRPMGCHFRGLAGHKFGSFFGRVGDLQDAGFRLWDGRKITIPQRSRCHPPQNGVGSDEPVRRDFQEASIRNGRRLVPIGRLSASFVALRQFDQRCAVVIEPRDRDVRPFTEGQPNTRRLQRVGRRGESVVKIASTTLAE
jgi:hypothetical protein